MLIENFSFDGNSLSGFNGILTSNNDEIYKLAPTYTVITHKIPNVAEEKFIKKIRNPYEFSLEMYFENVVSPGVIRDWLDKSEPKPFTFTEDFCGIGTIQVVMEDMEVTQMAKNGSKYSMVIVARFKEYSI